MPAAGLSAALPLLCVQGGSQHSALTRCNLTSGAAPQQQDAHSGMPTANSTPIVRGTEASEQQHAAAALLFPQGWFWAYLRVCMKVGERCPGI